MLSSRSSVPDILFFFPMCTYIYSPVSKSCFIFFGNDRDRTPQMLHHKIYYPAPNLNYCYSLLKCRHQNWTVLVVFFSVLLWSQKKCFNFMHFPFVQVKVLHQAFNYNSEVSAVRWFSGTSLCIAAFGQSNMYRVHNLSLKTPLLPCDDYFCSHCCSVMIQRMGQWDFLTYYSTNLSLLQTLPNLLFALCLFI